MRGPSLLLLLLLFWACLSGEYHHVWLPVAGVVVAVATAWLVARQDLLVEDWGLGRLARVVVFYLPWLVWEILVANARVVRVVWHPDLPIDPSLVETPCRLRTGTGRALFANSITLTPGTVTVELEPDRYLVHALTADDASGLAEAVMHDRVAALEPRP